MNTDSIRQKPSFSDSEFNGGIIEKECPHCGQFCKVPDTYIGSYKGSYANSYCKRCKKEVKLRVIFI